MNVKSGILWKGMWWCHKEQREDLISKWTHHYWWKKRNNVHLPLKNYDVPKHPNHLVQPRGLVDPLQSPGQQLCGQQCSWVPRVAMASLLEYTVYSSYCSRKSTQVNFFFYTSLICGKCTQRAALFTCTILRAPFLPFVGVTPCKPRRARHKEEVWRCVHLCNGNHGQSHQQMSGSLWSGPQYPAQTSQGCWLLHTRRSGRATSLLRFHCSVGKPC